MLEKYYLKPQTIDRIRANWLAEPIERYVPWLHDRGGAARNVFSRVPFLLRFGAYAQSKGAKVWSDLPQHVQGFGDDWMRGRNGNYWTDRGVRLWRRDCAEWDGENIHEKLRVRGQVGSLCGDLWHYTAETLDR